MNKLFVVSLFILLLVSCAKTTVKEQKTDLPKKEILNQTQIKTSSSAEVSEEDNIKTIDKDITSIHTTDLDIGSLDDLDTNLAELENLNL